MVRLIVEKIPPLYLCCDMILTAQDIASASRFQNQRRRNEHLAWRRIVRRELGNKVNIGYNDVGAPIVDTPNIYISIAHSAEMVAVAIANERVGVDIEFAERDFSFAANRYMSDAEQQLSDDIRWQAIVWCCKEACYKYLGAKGVDLRNDIVVKSYDSASKRMRVDIADGSTIEVEISIHDAKYIVATTVTK